MSVKEMGLRAPAGKADGLEATPALARRSAKRGGGTPPRQGRRGAVETPPVQSVERALSILEAVARSSEPVPLANLTDVLGIDPSSVFRLANTLKRRGFLANPNGRKHYVLGPAVWRLSREYDWSRMLISICRESVKALAVRTGETAHLAVREGRDVFFIDHYASGDQGVIVADLTVDRSGQVRRLQIVRSPGIARLNNMVQASVKTASPLPAPPAGLMKTGTMTYSETWLFTNDSRWRLRTLTLPQE